MTTNYHIHHEPDASIDCVLVTPEADSILMERYPRMRIGDLTLFPSEAQIVILHAVLTQYLADRGIFAAPATEAASAVEEAEPKDGGAASTSLEAKPDES